MRLIIFVALISWVFGFQPAWGDGPDEVLSFAHEIKLLEQVAACQPGPLLSPPSREALVRKHCRTLAQGLKKFQEKWLTKAIPFFKAQVPPNVSKTIVYPFGGADLVTLLTIFPKAETFTSISLESSGDPRGFQHLSDQGLATELEFLHAKQIQQLSFAHSKTTNLSRLSRAAMTAEQVFSLIALGIHGYEVVDLRFFHLEDDGSMRYLTQQELDSALENLRPGSRAYRKRSRELFANMELTFQYISMGPAGPLKRYRHIKANLVNSAVRKNKALQAYIRAQGRIASLFKAASFLIPQKSFSEIRDLILAQADWMVSDSTGVLPDQARKHGFTIEAFGRYKGAYLDIGEWTNSTFVPFWASRKYQALKFRFGYPDNSRNHHMLIYRKRQDP